MVTPEQLLELISSGERNDVEFKERLEGESVKKTIVAFANDWSRTGGGTLILGVAKNGRVVGIRETQDQALQLIANFSKDGSIDPKPSVDPHPVLYNGKLVLVVRVPAGRRPPYRYEGRTYIRVGSTTHIATIEQEEILRERSLLPEDQRSQPLVSLPPRESIVVDFVGRSEELSVLNNWLSDPWLRRCSIVGQGGCGKTALAYEFATKVAESRFPYSGKRIDCIVWLSAKRKRFYAGEVRELSPDFSDFESLLSAILTAAGFTEYAELPVNERAAQVLELLSAFPTLLIVDDLDTLLGRRDDPDVARAIEFVLDAIPKKERAKVLVTSRQAVLWAQAVYVKAFPKDSDEGLAFVESRMKLLELESLLGREQKREILRVTDGIPLYVEELLRLIKITANPRRAIQEWQQHGGRRAREFALARECEALGKEAQLFLIACAVLGGFATEESIVALTGLSREEVRAAADELQGVFLINLGDSEEGAGFVVSTNTRELVLDVFSGRREMKRLRERLRALKGELYGSGAVRRKVGERIRRASWLVQGGRGEEAEDFLMEALAAGETAQHPDLWGALGWVRKVLGKVLEAREAFETAGRLKSRNVDAYKHWARLEIDREEWLRAAKAAELGLSQAEGNKGELAFLAGYARSRLARELEARLDIEGAVREVERAEEHFSRASAEAGSNGDLRRWVLRARVLNAEVGWRLRKGLSERETRGSREADKLKRKWERILRSNLREWERSYPEDERLSSERERLKSRYPELFKEEDEETQETE